MRWVACARRSTCRFARLSAILNYLCPTRGPLRSRAAELGHMEEYEVILSGQLEAMAAAQRSAPDVKLGRIADAIGFARRGVLLRRRREKEAGPSLVVHAVEVYAPEYDRETGTYALRKLKKVEVPR